MPKSAEITDAMIKAGADVLWDLQGECTKETLATAVFRAMSAAAELPKKPMTPAREAAIKKMQAHRGKAAEEARRLKYAAQDAETAAELAGRF